MAKAFMAKTRQEGRGISLRKDEGREGSGKREKEIAKWPIETLMENIGL